MNDLRQIVIEDFSDAAVVDNYRISADGTLTKRDGFRTLTSLGEHIRGYCYDGADTIYAVAGSKLFKITAGTPFFLGELSEAVFEDETERCLMYSYAGIVYMIGGNAFYCYNTTDPLSPPKTYERIPVTKSTLNQYPTSEFNLISDRAREYDTVSLNSHTYAVRGYPLGICRVTLNDVILSPSQYTLSNVANAIYISITDTSLLSPAPVFMVEYLINSDVFMNKKSICSKCSNAYVYEGESGVRVLLYGGEEGCIYYSEATREPLVETVTSEATRELLPGTVIGEQFSAGNMLFAENEGEKILNILPFNGRTLVFTDRAAYYLVEDTEMVSDEIIFIGFHLVPVYSELSIGKSSGIVKYDGDIYFIGPLGLYSLSYNPIEYKYTSNRLDIPDNAKTGLGDMDSVTLHVDKINHELWLGCADKCSIYSFVTKKWYRFSGFSPTSLFTYQNESAFTEADRICIFTAGERLDGGEGFEAYVETHNLDLGNIFAEKTIYSFGTSFERCEGAALECTLKSDKGASFSFRVSADDNDADTSPVVKRTHARLGNCYYIICRVSSPADAAPANLRSILISYRFMEENV